MRTASGIPLGVLAVGFEGRGAAGMFRVTHQARAGAWKTDHVLSDAQKPDHLKALPGW
jgi:hypothetical protein